MSEHVPQCAGDGMRPSDGCGLIEHPIIERRTDGHDSGVHITSTDLTLRRPLAELSDSQRRAVSDWLIDHQIDPSRVALNRPVQRHEASSSVSWREDDGTDLLIHHFFPAVQPQDGWPAPFPEGLLDP